MKMSDTPRPASNTDILQGTISRCARCAISVYTISSPAPAICPFCHHAMKHSRYETPVGDPIELDEDMEARVRQLYKHPPRWVILALGLLGTLLLSVAVYFQVNNFEHYWYSPTVNIYSLIVGLFIVSRFVISAFYRAPPDVGYRPHISALVPCMNEQGSIARSLARIYAEGYPREKIEVVTVNDGSTDNTLKEMLRTQTHYTDLVVANFEKNRGLCYGMAFSTLLARGEFTMFVDSDTFLMPGALEKLVQGFIDPTVGGIAGHTDVENSRVNLLTKMQDVRYFFSYKIMKAAESVFGTVSCLPGCFSAYRRACVLHVMDEWMHEKVFGVEGNYGDDRSLTNLILRDYQVLYDDEARATTIAPESWKVYTKQQARWMRSSLRGMMAASGFMWRKHPVPALSWYAMMYMPVFEPFIMLWALVIAPILQGYITTSYIFGVFAITLIWSLHFYQNTGRTHWWAGFAFTGSYVLFYSWQIYYAFFTLATKKWGTRGAS